MQVLIIEDDQRLVRLLRRILEEEHYTVDVSYEGIEGEKRAFVGCYDLIILDIMLPGRDGVEVCRRLRAAHVVTPILMLTARDGIRDRVHGLDAGADDYLIKPFASMELLARLRALSRRRATEIAEARLAVDGLVMDLIRHEVTRDGRTVELTAREFALLEYFLRHAGQVLTRAQILGAVWQYDTVVVSNVVDTYVHYLRDKIDRGFKRKLLQTVRGVGYVLRA